MEADVISWQSVCVWGGGQTNLHGGRGSSSPRGSSSSRAAEARVHCLRVGRVGSVKLEVFPCEQLHDGAALLPLIIHMTLFHVHDNNRIIRHQRPAAAWRLKIHRCHVQWRRGSGTGSGPDHGLSLRSAHV